MAVTTSSILPLMRRMATSLGEMAFFRQATPPSRPTFYFIGSAVSAMGVTGLPKWDEFVKGLMTGLGRCAGLQEHDIKCVERLDSHRQTIKISIASELTKHPGARRSYLENYHMTDILSRRLGEGYLKVLEVFQGAKSNEHHKSLVDAMIKCSNGQNEIKGIVTTNFDTCIDSYLDEKLSKGDLQLCKMTGKRSEDLDLLDAVQTEDRSKPIFLLCQSLRSFDLVASLMYHFAEKGSRYRIIFNIHGTANDTITCIDSNFQREQRLPYGVSQALYSLYVKCNLVVAGYSGLDLNENLDYLRMESNMEYLNAIWLVEENKTPPENRENFPPARLNAKMMDAKYKNKPCSFAFQGADLNIGNESTEEKDEREKEFIDLLDLSVAEACSYEPIWAALALQDLVRALLNELRRCTPSEEKKETKNEEVKREGKQRLIRLPSIEQKLVELQSKLSHRLEMLTTKRDILVVPPSQTSNGSANNSVPTPKPVSVSASQAKSESESESESATSPAVPLVKALTDDGPESLTNGKKNEPKIASEESGQKAAVSPLMSPARSESIQRAWTEGWLMNNFRNPSDLPGLGALVVSLMQLIRRIKRNLEPLKEHPGNLDKLAELMESDPQRFADAWVVWATYIMLNYHDSDRKRLCWSYYLNAVRSAIHSGNIWGKIALDDLRKSVWTDLLETSKKKDERNALRFHREPPKITSEDAETTIKALQAKFNPLQVVLSKKQNYRTVIDFIHVLGIDPELPVHHHAQIPLPEYYRVLLAVALLFGKQALIRQSAGKGHYTFLQTSMDEATRKLDLFHQEPDQAKSTTNDTLKKAIYTRLHLVEESDEGKTTDFSAFIPSLPIGSTEQHPEKQSLPAIGANPADQSPPAIDAKKTAKLREAFTKLVNMDEDDSLLAREIIVDFLVTIRGDNFDRKKFRRQNEIFVEDVMKQLHGFVTRFSKLEDEVTWSRDLLYDIFHLNGKKVVELTKAQYGILVDEDLRNWIDHTYRKKPWKYQEILQLLIRCTFALSRPVQKTCIEEKPEAVLVANEYQIHLFILGVLAHTTSSDRPNLQVKVHMLNGAWYDYQRFALADIARMRQDDAADSKLATGEAGVMQYLKMKQLEESRWNDSSLHARSKSVHATPQLNNTKVEDHLEKRRITANRLAEEFIVCSNRPLPPVYVAPDFKAYIFQLVSTKVPDDGSDTDEANLDQARHRLQANL